MVEYHRSDTAVITGSSTHNERIDHLWRDAFRCVCSVLYRIFRSMESDGELDPLNEIDIFCSHYVFLPRINVALDSFVNSWNNHSLSSEHNFTPNQFFVQGALQQNHRIVLPSESDVILPHPGEHVTVPTVTFVPCQMLQQKLSLTDLPIPSIDCGRNVYMLVIGIVGQHLMNDCIHCLS